MTTLEPAIIRHRMTVSLVWCAIATCVLVAGAAGLPLFAMATWLSALIVLLVTNRSIQLAPEEQLVRSRAYRALAGLVFGACAAGCVIGMLPVASDKSQLLAIFFGGTAIFAYRVLVARSPRPAMLLATITSFAWMPAALVLVVTCKCGHHDLEWTEITSHALFVALLVLVGALLAVTLVAFRRRTTDLPDARVL